MTDLCRTWVRFRDIPDDMLEDMPEHVRTTFLAARRAGFEVEMLCPGAKIPPDSRAPRRFVLVADDLGEPGSGGPVDFDLAGLAADVQASHRMFVISTAPYPELYAAAYAAAVEDLTSGYQAAVVVETKPNFAEAWARTLAALQEGGAISDGGTVPSCSSSQQAPCPPRNRTS